jgi:hypothetical protein
MMMSHSMIASSPNMTGKSQLETLCSYCGRSMPVTLVAKYAKQLSISQTPSKRGRTLALYTSKRQPPEERSNPHEFIQLRRCHAPVDETELACVSHLVCSLLASSKGCCSAFSSAIILRRSMCFDFDG